MFFLFFLGFPSHEHEDFSIILMRAIFVCLSCFDDDHDDNNRACCNGVDTRLLNSLVAWVDDQTL